MTPPTETPMRGTPGTKPRRSRAGAIAYAVAVAVLGGAHGAACLGLNPFPLLGEARLYLLVSFAPALVASEAVGWAIGLSSCPLPVQVCIGFTYVAVIFLPWRLRASEARRVDWIFPFFLHLGLTVFSWVAMLLVS